MPAKVVPWKIVRRRLAVLTVVSIVATAVSLTKVSIPLGTVLVSVSAAIIFSISTYVDNQILKGLLIGTFGTLMGVVTREFYPAPIRHGWPAILQVLGLGTLLVCIAVVTIAKPHPDRRPASPKDRVA